MKNAKCVIGLWHSFYRLFFQSLLYRPASPLQEETYQEEEVLVDVELKGPIKIQTLMTDFFPIVRNGEASYLHWNFPAPIPGVVRIIVYPKMAKKIFLQLLITQFFDLL